MGGTSASHPPDDDETANHARPAQAAETNTPTTDRARRGAPPRAGWRARARLDVPVLAQQEVRRLQVPVNDVALVEIVHPPGHIEQQLELPRRRRRARAGAEVVGEGAPRHQLRHEDAGRGGEGADELDDVLVADAAEDGELLGELPDELRREETGREDTWFL